ncbi:MAG TPA: FtsX-like permease family protein [Thermoanaerobaculia bacterium]|nr:FtsX-like permease family protein [Thermoanaerobaculia bacterium]
MSVWALALRNVRRNRRRSLLTAGIVVFGFAAFALAGGFVSQTFSGLKDGTIRGGVGHLQIARPETFAGAEERTLEHGIADVGKVEAEVARDPAVAAVLPRIDFVGLVSNGSRSVPYLGVGFEPADEAKWMETRTLIVSGRWFARPGEIAVVLGTGLAGAVGAKPGDTVTVFGTTPDGVLNAIDATVAGLAELPVKELNDRYLATTIPAASKLLDAGGTVSKLVVMLKPGERAEDAAPRLRAHLAAAGTPLAVRTWRELATFYNQVKILYAGIFGFMGAVLVIVVLLACANTMTMAAAERTREIGTLRAIGTPPETVRRMFVAEGLLLALAGCLAGAALALLVREGLNASHVMLPPPPGASHGTPIHVAFFPLTYLAGFVAMLATLAAASYFPARRASRIPIVDALAHV